MEVTAWDSSSLLKRVGKERMPGALKEEQLADGATIRRCIYTPHSLRATTATLLLDANVDIIKVKDLLGHRPAPNRALIALMGYTIARVGAVIQMKVEDYYIQKRRGWVRLHEKGGKVNEMPCHHNLEAALDEWLQRSGVAAEPTAPLFPTLRHGKLDARLPLAQANVHWMIQRRALAAGIATKISRNYRVPQKRRQVGSGAADGRARVGAHHGPVRSPRR